ncbi:putative leucine-rich repeat-containing protein DDB_G0290503 [Clytia hemisphaerica]|uniref:putative leucine-rich repeat-containing protein DDB_G0290503 n=1 Tax=Clytia hemisphaerica TaxID=252671 RepID=UPI0034D40B61
MICREGQNIINKLLADISRNRGPAKCNTSEVNEEAPSFKTNNNTKHVTKSYDLQSKSPAAEEKPFKSQEDYYEESYYHENEANTSRLLKWKLNSSLDNSLQNEVTFLKDELANLEMKKSQEILTLSERTERQISTLQKKLSTTTKEKDLIQEENEQLKESLSKKEHLCLQLQEILNEKSQQIVRMQHQETENRSNLNTEAFYKQLSKIKEFESQFKEMKEQRDISMIAKEEEIAELKQQNEFLKNEVKNVQNDVYTNPDITTLRTQLMREVQKNKQLQQDSCSPPNIPAEITTLRTQLMREVQKNKQLQQDLRNVDDIHRNLENVKFQLNQHQKLFKSLAIELFEECTKMSVIKGSSPKSPKLTCSSSPGDKEQTNILVNAMKTFKENFDDFRSYTISIQEKLKTQSSLELSQSPSANNSSPTTSISNKLLRHLQNRVQQLRQENIQLKENLKNSSLTY